MKYMFKETIGRLFPVADKGAPPSTPKDVKSKTPEGRFADWYELSKRIVRMQARDRAVRETVQTAHIKTIDKNHELMEKESLEQVISRASRTPFIEAEQGLMMATWILPDFNTDPYMSVIKELRDILEKVRTSPPSPEGEKMQRINLLADAYYVEDMFRELVKRGEEDIEQAAKERFAPVATLAEDLTRKYLDRFFASRGYGPAERQRLLDNRFSIGFAHEFNFALVNVPYNMGISDELKAKNTIYLRSVSDTPDSDMVLDEAKLLSVLVHEQLHSRSAHDTDVGTGHELGLDVPEMFNFDKGAYPKYQRPEVYLNEIATEYTARHIVREYHQNKGEEDVWIGATAESMELGYQTVMKLFARLLDKYPNDAASLLDQMSVALLEDGKWRELKQYLDDHPHIYRDLKKICSLEHMINSK